MKVYDLYDSEGRVFAFEVPSSLGRRGVLWVVERIPGAHISKRPKFLSSMREEEFCEFEVDGEPFVAWEPFGDNSRYWIGPKECKWIAEVDKVRAAFQCTDVF